MNLKRIKCMIVGHEWVVHGFEADIASARTCRHCAAHIPAVVWPRLGQVPPLRNPPPPVAECKPLKSSPHDTRARVLGWGISIPEMQRVPPPPVPPPARHDPRLVSEWEKQHPKLSRRIQIDDSRDVVTVDGHPISGEALTHMLTVQPEGRWFRVADVQPGGAIVITTKTITEVTAQPEP